MYILNNHCGFKFTREMNQNSPIWSREHGRNLFYARTRIKNDQSLWKDTLDTYLVFNMLNPNHCFQRWGLFVRLRIDTDPIKYYSLR